MPIRIALAGNPNSGKTTLFNELTGSNQYVGNWPGVTVEKKDGSLRQRDDVIIQDLPGIYSLSPYTMEEVVTRNYLVEDKPDAIINIVDGTNIERNLYLTTQLLELNLPIVVAINMMDVVEKKGDKLDMEKLSAKLGCAVMPLSALNGDGCMDVVERAIELVKDKGHCELPHVFSGSVEHALAHIEESLQDKVSEEHLRWYAVKVFERDEKVLEKLALSADDMSHIEVHIADCEKEMDDDAESIITNQRYCYISKLVSSTVKKQIVEGGLTTSDKIDKIVTNRVLALPLFALIIWFMYWISVTTVGTWMTDWANDGVFGDGWFLAYTCDTEKWEEVSGAYGDAQKRIEAFEAAYMKVGGKAGEPGEDGEVPAIGDIEKAKTIEAKVLFEDEESGEIMSEEVVNYDAYLKAQEVPEPDPREYGVWIPGLPVLAEALLDKIGAGDLARSIILDALLGGVGTVFGFLPQILIVFLFLAFLEDCGYMARVAFIMDRIFRRFGLSGKSFIPMLVSLGCGVPAVMASRTIESEQDRRMTILLSTFVPCSAKVAIIAMICSAFFREQSWVAPSMYFIGIAIIVLGGIALKKTKRFYGEPAPFVLELPAYHMPTFRNVMYQTWDRGRGFCIKAGTVIFPACVVLWLLTTFSWSFEIVADMEQSMLASIGGWIEWIFAPLGFGDWKGAVACITAEIAKEEAVATLSMLAPDVEGGTLRGIQALFASFSPYPECAAFAFMVVNLFFPPCLVAIITTFREMGSKGWGWFALIFQLFVGYVLAFLSYQLGTWLFFGASFGIGTGVALLVILGILYAIARPGHKGSEVK